MNLFKKKFSSFVYLNTAQFLINLNDSVFRLVVTYCLIELLGAGHTNQILSLSAALFVLPFLIFLIPAGRLADRYSKKELAVILLALEVLFMVFALISIWIRDVFTVYFSLFLVALQASFFSPIKYAILPEIEPKERLSRVNGYFTLCVYLSIIVGTFLASFLLDLTHRNYFFVVFVCFLFSCIALLSGTRIEKTAPRNPTKQIHFFFFKDIFSTVKLIKQYPHLLLVIFSSAYFLFTAGYTQLNLIPFGMQSLGITDVATGYVYLFAAIGIGIGAYFVGMLSGKQVELGFSVLGAIGTGVSYMLLWVFQTSLPISCTLLFFAGVCGGLYVIPLETYVQRTSPEGSRGEIIGVNSFFCFFGVLIAAGLIAFLGSVLDLSAAISFFIVGSLTLCYALFFFASMPHSVYRLFFALPPRFTITIKEELPALNTLIVAPSKTKEVRSLLFCLFADVRFVKFYERKPSQKILLWNYFTNTISLYKNQNGAFVVREKVPILAVFQDEGPLLDKIVEALSCKVVSMSITKISKKEREVSIKL